MKSSQNAFLALFLRFGNGKVAKSDTISSCFLFRCRGMILDTNGYFRVLCFIWFLFSFSSYLIITVATNLVLRWKNECRYTVTLGLNCDKAQVLDRKKMSYRVASMESWGWKEKKAEKLYCKGAD
jgi:hypothetical protein